MATDLHSEKLALRLLCVGTPQGPVKEVLIPLLRGYPWQSTLHQAIFDALAAAASSDPELIRRLLPAKLTRMGFPDVEWEELFAPLSMSREESIALVRQMVGAV
jgi:hypothetical protein